MSETSKTRPPEGYETWLEAVMSDTELRSHWLFGDPEKGGYHERQDAVKFARAELAALRARCEQLRGERDEANGVATRLSEIIEKVRSERDALRAENAKLREMLSMCGDVAAGMLLPAEDDTDWRALKRDIDTALGNAQEAT